MTDLLGNRFFLWILIISIFVISFVLWNNSIIPFMAERDYIKMEMERSFDDDRYRYWKSRLKALYLRSIPFIGRILRK